MTLRADDDRAVEAGRRRLLELVHGRVRTADADTDHVVRLEATAFRCAHRAEHGFVVQTVSHPVLEVRVLGERDVGCVEGVFRVGLRLRRFDHVGLRETGGDERVGCTGGAVNCGGQLVVGHVDRADIFHVPAALLDFRSEAITHLLADVVRRDAHMRHRCDRLARAVDETVVHRHHLQAVGLRLGDDARSELDVRRADHKALCFLRRQVVDCAHHLLARRRADFHQREALFLGGDFGELPFVLEPRFFRLLHEEADLDRIGSLHDRCVEEHTRRRCCQREENSSFHDACLLTN